HISAFRLEPFVPLARLWERSRRQSGTAPKLAEHRANNCQVSTTRPQIAPLVVQCDRALSARCETEQRAGPTNGKCHLTGAPARLHFEPEHSIHLLERQVVGQK